MNATETRREAYIAIKPKRADRRTLILETLGDRHMTVEEITDELLKQGHIRYYDRNFVAPRITELRNIGIVKEVGTRVSSRTGIKTAVWAKTKGQA